MDAYRRARLIDGVTTDDDKVAPVYKLEEICKLLEESTADVVKEVSDYLLQRLDRGSPSVKQKALRLIKFAVPKAGREFRRYIQRRASDIKSYFHYRGHPDPLRGDAPNKAVREMAHEAVQAIFTQPEDPRSAAASAPAVGISRKKMEGFGNTPTNSPMVQSGTGAGQQASIQDMLGKGVAILTGAGAGMGSAHSRGYAPEEEVGSKGSYAGPQAYVADRFGDSHGFDRGYSSRGQYGEDYGDYDRREFRSPRDREYGGAPYGGANYHNEAAYSDGREGGSEAGRAAAVGGQEGGQGSLEEKAVEMIASQGGVRLQPTRDALKEFVSGLPKLNAVRVAQALEGRLGVKSWQVRLRALCVLEAILRTQEPACDEVFAYFVDGPHAVTACLDHPQTSVAEKARRVLDVLGVSHSSPSSRPPASSSHPASLAPDLIDISEPPPPAANTTASISLLDGLSPAQASSSEGMSQAASSDLLGDTTPAFTSTAAGAASVLGAVDLLGGLPLDSVSGGGGPAGTAGTGAASGASAGAGGDIFGMGVELLSPTQDASVSAQSSGGGGSDLFSGLEVNEDAGVNAVKSMLQQPAPPPIFAVPSIGGVAAAGGMAAGAYSLAGAGIGVNPMATHGVHPHPWMAHAQPMAAPHMLSSPGNVPHVMHAAAGTASFNPAVAFPHPTAMHAAAYGGAPTRGVMPMGFAGQVPGAWPGSAAHGFGHGHGISPHGGAPVGAAGMMGAVGRAPVDFDFSGDPTVRSPVPKASTDTTKAFDFVTEQMAKMGSGKTTSTLS